MKKKKKVTYEQLNSWIDIRIRNLKRKNAQLNREGQFEVHELDRMLAIQKIITSLSPSYYDAILSDVKPVHFSAGQLGALQELRQAYDRCFREGVVDFAI